MSMLMSVWCDCAGWCPGNVGRWSKVGKWKLVTPCPCLLLLLLPPMSPQCYLHNLLQLPPIPTNHCSLSLWRYNGQGRRNQVQSQISSWAILAFFGFVLLTKLRYFVCCIVVFKSFLQLCPCSEDLKQIVKIAILMQAQSRLRTRPLSMSADFGKLDNHQNWLSLQPWR